MTTNDPILDPETLLREGDAAELLQMRPKTLEAWRHRGGGPAFIKISTRCIRYRRADLLGWITDRRRESTSDRGAEM